MIKACLFDLDGTVLDTINTIAWYCNKALEKFGIEAIPVERYNYLAGKGAKNLVESMLRERNCFSEELFSEVFSYYMSIYDTDPYYLTKPFDGIEELLASLKAMGIKTAVISNKPDFATKSLCQKMFALGSLDTVRGQVEGVKLKPHTEGVELVMNSLGVNKDEILYIGDTDVDMQTGKNLGAYTVGVLWGFRDAKELNANGADELVSHPAEILHIIERINKK